MNVIPVIENLRIEIGILEKIRDSSTKPKEICTLNQQISIKSKVLNECLYKLSNMPQNTVEYRLYTKLINGMNPSKAIEEIAEENYIDNIKPTSSRAIWDIYNKKIKKILKK